jgi:primosomal protein N' (replication factor Y) (superfamily II helicase)
MDAREARTFLLHGVTSSGKTEVYLQAIEKAVREGGCAIVLVPEISLTPQTVARFRSRFAEMVGVYHSRLTLGQKYDLWRRVRSGECRIMVGARSAIFTPFENLRVIVVDEEQETSYKQDSTPRYHARDVAVVLGRNRKAVVLLGSATPSIETYFNAQNGKYGLLVLPERIDRRPLPEVRVVDMTREAKENQSTDIFSTHLRTALEETLARGEQALLFLNRRGFFSFALCMSCSTVVRCAHCDVALTHHKPRNVLVCHYCSRECGVPKRCPECDSAGLSLVGIGTQRIEEHVAELLPEARVIRMDLDTTRRRNAFIDAWRSIEQGEVDIILGTQMIAKGFHLEQVTLVGVPLADVSLFQCDFRSAERAFSMLTQVAGRAGRGEKPGHVLIQTYVPYHYAIQYAQTHDYRGFYDKELQVRRTLRFPPHFRLVSVLASGRNLDQTVEHIRSLARHLQNAAFRTNDAVMVLGPAPAPIGRINDLYRWRLFLRGTDPRQMRQVLRDALARHAELPGKSAVQLVVDVDPQDLM